MKWLTSLLYNTKEKGRNVTGKKIRMLRNTKKMTAAELGKQVGLAENSIRNYENGSRQVSDEKLALIAEALGVPMEALLDRRICNYLDVSHILFEMADDYELIPAMLPQEPKYALLTKDETILQILEVWYEKHRQWEQGQITQLDYKAWKDAFPLLCDSAQELEEPIHEKRYTDFERISSFKSTVETLDAIVDLNVSEALECLDVKDYAMLKEKLENMRSTVHHLSEKNVSKYG